MIHADEVPPPLEESGETEPAGDEEPVEASEEAPKTGRRRRKPNSAKAAQDEASEIEADSSPMVERPVGEEVPISETDAPAEAKPKKPRRSRKKEAAPVAEVEAAQPAPADAPPAETSEEAKPKRRSRKKAAEPAQTVEAAGVPEAYNDSNGDESGKPRSGWWQRTFG